MDTRLPILLASHGTRESLWAKRPYSNSRHTFRLVSVPGLWIIGFFSWMTLWRWLNRPRLRKSKVGRRRWSLTVKGCSTPARERGRRHVRRGLRADVEQAPREETAGTC
jgi:hypothetical protein